MNPLSRLALALLAALTGGTGPAPGQDWQGPAPVVPDAEPLPPAARARLGTFAPRMQVRAASLDGKWLATTQGASNVQDLSCPVHLWDATTGKHVRVLKGCRTGVLSAAFSANGSVLAAGGMDNALQFWDVKTGASLGRHAHVGHVYDIAFSADGKRLATGSNEVRLWDAVKRQEVRKLEVPAPKPARPEYFFHVAFAPDGKTLATGSEQHLRLWDVESGRHLHALVGTHLENRLTFSADGKTVFASRWPESLVRGWDVPTGRLVIDLKRDRSGGDKPTAPPQFAFAADGRTAAWGELPLASAYAMYAVHVGRLPDLKARAEQVVSVSARIAPPDLVASFAFVSGDGKLLALGGVNGSLRLWDAINNKERRTLAEPPHPILALRMPGNGDRVLALTRDGWLREWTLAPARERRRRTLPLGAGEVVVRLSPDGKTVATLDPLGKPRLWDVATGKLLWNGDKPLESKSPAAPPWETHARPAVPTPTVVLEFSPAGRALAGIERSNTAEVSVAVWEPATGKALSRLTVPQGTACLALADDGKTLFTDAPRTPAVDKAGTAVRVWDWTTGKELRTFRRSPPPKELTLAATRALLLSPNGKTLAAREELHTLPPPPPPPGAPSRPWFPTSSWQVRLWDVTTGKELRTLPCGAGGALAFSADGGRLALGHSNGVSVYDRATNKTGGAAGHQGPVSAVTFSPDGQTLVSGSDDGTSLIWDATKLFKPVNQAKE